VYCLLGNRCILRRLRLSHLIFEANEKMTIATINETQLNVLEAIADQTIISRGKRKGAIKSRISGDSYDGRTLNALASRGLIEYRIGSILGDGWAATEDGLSVVLFSVTNE
jgi:hypothetical protein